MKVSKFAGRLGILFGFALAGACLTGCKGDGKDPRFAEIPGLTPQPQTKQVARTTAPAPTPVNWNRDAAPSAAGATSPIDIIQVGESLVITFADLPLGVVQPPIEDRVRDDGTIMLIQNLRFQAAGKHRTELEKEIHDKYVPDYFKTLSVSVRPKEATQFYFVDGEVKRPDRQIYMGPTTVLRAISSANGFTDFARKTAVLLIRADGSKYTINCSKAQRDPNLDLPVYPGDRIQVFRRNPIW